MTEPEQTVIQATMRLRAASPAAYADLLDALSVYAASARDTVLSATLENLPNVQGRAQSLRSLYELIRRAPELADKMPTGRK